MLPLVSKQAIIIMSRKVFLFIISLLIISFQSNAQKSEKTAIVKGKLINKATGEPAHDVQVAIQDLDLSAVSDAQGIFTFSQVPYGTHSILIGGGYTKTESIRMAISKEVVDLGTRMVEPNEKNTSINSLMIPTIALDDNNISTDDGAGMQNISGLLTASRDPFLNTMAFTFGQYSFNPRGYDRGQQQALVNGIMMNDIETGAASWSQWGGLNDIFRGRSTTYGLAPSDYTFGDINGSVYFDATAANQRKETRISYSLTNRTYRNRLMVTHNSGVQANGWAYSVSASKRWAQEGYTPGTFYDGYAYYAGVSKKWEKHQFSLSTFGSPTRRGKATLATGEAYDLAGTHFYNPNWGYQNGEVRNARVADYFQPFTILNYEFNPNENTKIIAAAGYLFGKYKNSIIDWYNGGDPRPDYYKNMPSYYKQSYMYNQNAINEITALYKNNPEEMQIDWDNLYNVNRMNTETIRYVNGNPNDTIRGNRSVYVVANDVDDTKKWSFNTSMIHTVNDHITVYTGLTFIKQRTESYKELVDLLGGDFYVNRNQFAERAYVGNATIQQNDLNNPNRIVKEGDKYNYDYITDYNKGWWWTQAVFKYNKFDLFVSGNIGYNSFYRDGLYRNGLFPKNSYGKSATQEFITYGVKGGATYKINGRNYLFVNGGYMTDPPTIENSYISIRTRDFTINNPKVQQTKTLEGGYLLRAPNMNARVVGYVTDITNAAKVTHFYNEGFTTFTNYVMQNINIRSIGTELSLDYKVSSSLSVTGVAVIGQVFYTNRPNVSIYQDNDTLSIATNKTIYIKNYYLATGPQSAYTLGFNYNSKRYWYAHLNFNYFDNNYVDIAPDRRSGEAVGLTEPGSRQWHQIIDQEKLPAAFTADLSIGKSFLLSKVFRFIKDNNMYLYLNIGIRNLFNNTDMVTFAYEQPRFDYANYNTDKFPSKYLYGFGRNYFINLAFKF